MRARKLSGLLVAGGLMLAAAAAAAAAPANADPQKGELIPVDCDNGKSYTLAVNGNGEFTPGHDVDSTSMLVPVAFGSFTGTLTDSQGNVVETFTDPGVGKGQSGKNAKNTVTCTVEFSVTFVEDGETFTFTGSGTVTGVITPRNGR